MPSEIPFKKSVRFSLQMRIEAINIKNYTFVILMLGNMMYLLK